MEAYNKCKVPCFSFQASESEPLNTERSEDERSQNYDETIMYHTNEEIAQNTSICTSDDLKHGIEDIVNKTNVVIVKSDTYSV